MEPYEWIVLVVAVLVGGAVAGRRSAALFAWLRGREVTVCLTCPKRGSHAECTLILDERRGAYAGVERCSLHEPGGLPRCDEACVRLLNLGMPIDRAAREAFDAREEPPRESSMFVDGQA